MTQSLPLAWCLFAVALINRTHDVLVVADSASDDVRPPTQPYKLPWWHPTLDNIARTRMAGPANHPLLNSKLRPFILAHTDEDHDFFDGPNGYVRKPEKLPGDHPNLDIYFWPAEKPSGLSVSVFSYHPNVDDAYSSGEAISENHPSVQLMLQNYLPDGHPDVDDLLRHPNNHPLPSWHPALSELVLQQDPVQLPTISVFSYHPDVDTSYAAGESISIFHPSVQSMLQNDLPEDHPNVDELLRDPTGHPLPSWHPLLSQLIIREDPVDLPTVSVFSYHPDVDASYSAGEAVSENHPSVHSMLQDHLPEGHPDVDDLLRDPTGHPLPSWHPSLSQLILREDPLDLPTISVFSYHPDVDASYSAGEAISENHPSVQSMLQDHLPEGHPDVDDLLRHPTDHPLPSWHPSLSHLIVKEDAAGDLPIISVSSYHPDVQQAYIGGEAIPENHPSVQSMMEGFLPEDHPNVDDLLQDPASHPLPDWHPSLSQMITRRGQTEWNLLTVSIAFDHVDIDSAYKTGSPIPPGHPSVDQMLNSYLPEGHPDVDSLLRSPLDHPLPSWHPSLNNMVEHRSFWSPGIIFALLVGFLMVLACLVRLLKQIKKNSRNAGAFKSPTCEDKVQHLEPENGSTYFTSPYELESLPRRRWNLHRMLELNDKHRAEHPMYEYEKVSVTVPRTRIAREKTSSASRSCWSHLMGTRIPRTQWTSGNALLCFFYVMTNVVALFASPNYGIDRGLGSLAAANTIFLIIPATRNSILTWFLGLPFDRVILYHRFVGRVTFVLAFLHFCWYFDRFLHHAAEDVYWTGFAALLCGLGIVATTTNWIRRRRFNVFFWAHYLFIGFFVFAYLHTPKARPFLLVGIGLYALDKVLRVFWTRLPQHTLLFENCGDCTAQVKFAKNPFARMMGRHQVGQYMFVNFPELSLTEWHPFSVSSGPNEPFIELHIRALGDHTRDIVELSKLCADYPRQTWIRSDGPYGYLNFNYRRYDVLMLVGGGIGVTPVVSLLKDIYGEARSNHPHCIKRVYAVWVMPHASEADLFLDTLLGFQIAATADPTLPELSVAVHCTRAGKDDVEAPLIAARPDFPSILDSILSHKPTSTLVFACGPGRMINQLWDESTKRNNRTTRVDFHHETFEF